MSTAASHRGFTQLPVARAKLLEDKKKKGQGNWENKLRVGCFATTNSVQCFEALVLEEVGEISALRLPLSIVGLLSVLSVGKVGRLIREWAGECDLCGEKKAWQECFLAAELV